MMVKVCAYIDDWLILAPTRWKLRRAIKAVNQVMANLLLEKHPDKTFIGRISKGFDFLGYGFSRQGLKVAKKTVERMMAKAAQLYEQNADDCRIESYLRHWWSWVRSGVDLERGILLSQGTSIACETEQQQGMSWSLPPSFDFPDCFQHLF
ncbi:MAG: hypothetical protein F6K21_15395 [Symploca sp. SIO2D2]|nr:hypothetical protein [Symploca sp. SIO2D2]